jgi:putative molybdenum cofactor biosynthesis protein A
MCRTIPIRGGPIFFRHTCRVECPLKAAFCRDNGKERRQVASGTKGNVFAALTDIENTEKIYLDNGVYKRNTALGSSWDLRIVHEGDQQVSGHGEGGVSARVPADLSVFIPYFKNLCERNVYPFIGTAQETQQR